MAVYTGVNAPGLTVQLPPTSYRKGLIKSCKSRLSSSVTHGGSHSIDLSVGGFKEFFYAAASGEATVTAWVYPEGGSNASLEVIEIGSGVKLDIANSVGNDGWEELSITWPASKKVYIIRIVNNARPSGSSTKDHVYFDDLV